MIFDSSIGGANSNSYVSVEDADDYFETSIGKPNWSSLSVTDKQKCLIESTRLLDTLIKWKGFIKSDQQALMWPRSYVPNPDSRYDNLETVLESYISDDIIPKDVKNATNELAYSLISNNGFQSEENELSSLKVGPISLDFLDSVKSNGLPLIVRSMISKWGYYNSLASNSVQTVRLVR